MHKLATAMASTQAHLLFSNSLFSEAGKLSTTDISECRWI